MNVRTPEGTRRMSVWCNYAEHFGCLGYTERRHAGRLQTIPCECACHASPDPTVSRSTPHVESP